MARLFTTSATNPTLLLFSLPGIGSDVTTGGVTVAAIAGTGSSLIVTALDYPNNATNTIGAIL